MMVDSRSSRVFPFLVSCGRSGSTLLRSMIDSHPDIAIPGESFFITKLLSRASDYEKDEGFDVEHFIDDAIALSSTARPHEPSFIDKWDIDRHYLRRTVISARPASYPEAIRAVFRCYADWRGKPFYGDKTPAYVLAIDQIADLLPESRFVHLIRDGRNVALAFRGAPFGPKTMEEIALHWRARVMAGREAGKNIGKDRYLEVKYEELVDGSESSLWKICNWLGFDFSPEMLDHRDSVKRLNLAFSRTHRNVLRPIQQDIRNWQIEMSAADIKTFEFIAGDALETLGYKLANPHIRIQERVLIGARRYFMEGKKLSRRVRGLGSAEWW